MISKSCFHLKIGATSESLILHRLSIAALMIHKHGSPFSTNFKIISIGFNVTASGKHYIPLPTRVSHFIENQVTSITKNLYKLSRHEIKY